jgi:hypothetical protein
MTNDGPIYKGDRSSDGKSSYYYVRYVCGGQ